MFDEQFVTALAVQIAARINPQMQRRNGATAARLLTVKKAAAYIGRTEQALQHFIHRREIVVVRKGRRVHLDRNDLDRWIEANKELCAKSLLAVRCEVEAAVVLNQTKPDAIQPPDTSQDILVDCRVGKKIYGRVGCDAQHRDFDFMPERLENTVRRPKALPAATLKRKAQCFG